MFCKYKEVLRVFRKMIIRREHETIFFYDIVKIGNEGMILDK